MTQITLALLSQVLSDFLQFRKLCLHCVSILRWRAAFYVAGTDGCVLNFLHLIDEFLAWKMKAVQKEVEARFYFSP